MQRYPEKSKKLVFQQTLNKGNKIATVKRNTVTIGLTGKVGNLVFRLRGSKTTVYIQFPRKAPLREKQIEAQLKFRVVVARAKAALNSETEREHFKALAKKEGKESTYSSAVANFVKQILM